MFNRTRLATNAAQAIPAHQPDPSGIPPRIPDLSKRVCGFHNGDMENMRPSTSAA
jgi:hypothetical protein